MTGRPSKYKPEYAKEAAKLCALGATDAQLADFFEVSLAELAKWAFEREEFYNAITQTAEEVAAYHAKFDAIKAKRQKWRKATETPASRVLNAVRSRFWAAVKSRTDARLFRDCGYTLEELMAHLEARFSDGMTWENYGSWHVDHVKPCALFDHSDKTQLIQCWALSNLQPLWASENLKKGAKYASA